ncbi:MAG: hypothetical protein KatS3mg110_2033 [Pirellulaceae bacterium]|nr:MAG: hypothetical protein KatS3mg110_2033 [Pirellulaceae bacterium]
MPFERTVTARIQARSGWSSQSFGNGVAHAMRRELNKSWHWIGCGLALTCLVVSSGCQITEGGQTLPSGYYLSDDVQYFPKGPEFKLSREAAALKEYKASQQLQAQP